MPEGHTIHRIARDHTRLLGGKVVRVSSPQGRFESDATRIDGAVLEAIEPYGKHLFYSWSTGDIGHIHLGLFGKYKVHRGNPPSPTEATRMRLRQGDITIDLAGPTVCSLGTSDDRDAIVKRLGPDPLRRDADPQRTLDKIMRSSRPIGALLLDQAVIAGIGNVYRAEILFHHGIHPERPGNSCSPEELAGLWETAVTMLKAGVKVNRIVTVTRDDIGWPRNKLIPRSEATYVYKRQICVRCGDHIRAIEVGNRACYYCPTDQPR